LFLSANSIWVVNCDPSLQLQDIDNTIQFFEVKPIHKQLGCIAPLSVQQIGNDIYFLSQHGILFNQQANRIRVRHRKLALT